MMAFSAVKFRTSMCALAPLAGVLTIGSAMRGA